MTTVHEHDLVCSQPGCCPDGDDAISLNGYHTEADHGHTCCTHKVCCICAELLAVHLDHPERDHPERM